MQNFEYKHALIDTNLLIDAANNRSQFDKQLFEKLREYKTKPAIDEVIRFEFLRTANNLTNLNVRNEFLELILGNESGRSVLPVNQETFINAKYISNIYYMKDRKIKPMDALIAAQLKKYKKNIILVICDHNDFTIDLFDRIQIITVDAGKSIFTVGIYSFNVNKYEKLVKEFKNSKNNSITIKK